MNDFYKFIKEEFPNQYERMQKYGRRNVSFSTVAPTGSLSILAKLLEFSNVTSGVEPMFMPFYMRRKKVNPSDSNIRVDFKDENGDTWQEYGVLMGGFKEWVRINKNYTVDQINNLTKEELNSLYEESPYFGATANDINWVRRVEIQGVIQKYITHSISSTINLPNDVSEEEVSKIYLESWKKGLKGITVYRDGSRSGVLVSDTTQSNLEFDYKDAPKRPKSLDGEAYHVTARGERFTVLVGLYNGKPYEVFCLGGEQFSHHQVGQITKKARGVYAFNDIDLDFNISDEEVALTRMISTALRHGSDIKYIVEQLNKADGTIVSFSKAVSRTLKKYIPDGTKSTVTCKDCNSENVIFEEGCHKCLDCGSSKCG